MKEQIKITNFSNTPDDSNIEFSYKGKEFYLRIFDEGFQFENKKTGRKSVIKPTTIIPMKNFIQPPKEEGTNISGISRSIIMAFAMDAIHKKLRVSTAEFEPVGLTLLNLLVCTYISKTDTTE